MLRKTKQHRQWWLSLAAEAWPVGSRRMERASWIAEQVNEQLWRTEPRIRRNSITHNAAIIVQMAEGVGSSAAADPSREP